MSEWALKSHPDILKDLGQLGTKELEIFYKKKEKIKQNPTRLKHLSGGNNCYREEITTNIRLVYYVEGNTIWLLTVGRHKDAYNEYMKRLYNLKSGLKQH